MPLLDAPSGTKHLDVRVQARRLVGAQTYEAWTARSIRLFMPDGIKIAEASAWTEFGGGTVLTIAMAQVFEDRGGAGALTAIEASLFLDLGGAAGLTVPAAEAFQEHGGGTSLTAASAALYIEVIP